MPTTYTAMPESVALAIASLGDQPPALSITPVLHPRDGVPNPASRTFWSATANAFYILRQRGTDVFGQTPNLADKLAQGNDLIDHGRRGPIGCDSDALAGPLLWDQADRATQTDRPGAPAAFHIIGWLPASATRERWRELVLEFLDREAVANGLISDWAIHAQADSDGRWIKKPHFHAVLTHRFWRAGRRTGEPNPAWLGSAKMRQRMIEGWAAVTA